MFSVNVFLSVVAFVGMLHQCNSAAPEQVCLYTEGVRYTATDKYINKLDTDDYLGTVTHTATLGAFTKQTGQSPVALNLLNGEIKFPVYNTVTALEYLDAGNNAQWAARFDWGNNDVSISTVANPTCAQSLALLDGPKPDWVAEGSTHMFAKFMINDIDNDGTDDGVMKVVFEDASDSANKYTVDIQFSAECLTPLNAGGDIATAGYLLTPTGEIDVAVDSAATFTNFAIDTPTTYYPIVDPLYVSSTAITVGNREVSFYETTTDQCIDTSKFVWTSAEDPVAKQDSCPETADREVDCKYPTYTDSARCGAQDSFCCKKEDKCLASTDLTCDLSTIIASILEGKDTVGSVDGVLLTTINYRSYQKLYLGEDLTFTCKTGTMFTYSSDVDVDSPTATKVKCLAYQTATPLKQHTTDFKAFFFKIGCSEKCNSIKHHESTTIDVDPTTSDVAAGTLFTISCKEPDSAFPTGLKTMTATCQSGGDDNNDVSSNICYTCNTPATAAELDPYLVGGTLTPIKVAAGQSATYTCNDNFSLENFATTNERVTETIACSADGGVTTVLKPTAACAADCPVIAADDAGHIYTWSTTGAVTTRKSIPTGTTYTVSCSDNTKTLPLDQVETVSCTASETIEIESCHKQCNMADLRKGSESGAEKILYTKEPGPTTWTTTPFTGSTVVKDTPIKFLCRDTAAFDLKWEEKDNNEISCSAAHYDFEADSWTPTPPVCERKCKISRISEGSYNAVPSEVIIGDPDLVNQAFPSGGMIRLGSKIKFSCEDAAYTIAGTPDNFEINECTGDEILLNSCQQSCPISSLPAINKNTVAVAVDDDDVEHPTVQLVSSTSWSVWIKCAEGYTMGHGNTSPIQDYLKCSLAGTFEYSDDGATYVDLVSIPLTKQCYAVPTIPGNMMSAAGDKTMKVTINLPADRETTDRSLEKVEVYDSSDTKLCEVETAALLDATHSYSCDATTTTTADIVNGVTVYPKITLSGEEIQGAATTGKAYYGPPALITTGNSITVAGTKTVKWTWDASAKTDADIYNANAELGMKYEVKLVKASVEVTTVEVDYDDMFDPSHVYDWSSKLVPTEEYTAQITTLVNFGRGGTASVNFKTGYGQPTVTTTRKTATETTLTIDLNLPSLNADRTVKVQLDSGVEITKTLTFTAGVATHDLTNLTPRGTHTLRVTVMSEDNVVSDEVTITFSQGPEAPTYDPSSWIITEDSITVKWVSKATLKYRLVLQINNDGTVTDVSNEETAEFDAAGEQTHVFTGLTAGATYQVKLSSESTVGGTIVEGDAASEVVTLYSCAKSDKSPPYTIKWKSNNAELDVAYLNADTNMIFTLTCPEGEQFTAAVDGTTDEETACTGPNQWDSHSICEPIPAATEKQSDDTGKIVGGIIGGLILLILLILLIYCCCLRRKSGGTGGGTSSGKKYSPRDEEKHHGSPDIPANGNGGDNISLEQKVSFNDDDDTNVVISNDNVYDQADNNV